MSRLIDADELIEWINEQREQVTKKQVAGTNGSIFTREALVTMQRCISTFENKINNQPTAFDTEKVVEEIKKLDLDGVSMVEDGKYTLVRRNEVISLIQTNGVCNGRQKSCKYCYKKDCPLSTEKTLSDKWSDIVKKVGVE